MSFAFPSLTIIACYVIKEVQKTYNDGKRKKSGNKKYFKKGSLINRDLPWCEMGGGGASLSKNRTL